MHAWRIVLRTQNERVEYVKIRMYVLAGRRILLSNIKRRKLSWFDHVCLHDTLPKAVLQRTVEDRVNHGRLA